MTLVSEIIQRAYRETNLIPLAGTVNTNQSAEALALFNTILLQTFGNEAGDELRELNVGGEWDDSLLNMEWIPDDTRLLLSLTEVLNVDADPRPYEGQRLAVVDVAGDLSTYPSVINGNGRLIEGFETADLNEDYMTRQWMYRGDTGNWVRIVDLAVDDEMPLGVEFDDYFIIFLAMRLNPRYGQTIDTASFNVWQKARNRIRARYRVRRNRAPTDPGLVRRDQWKLSSDDDAFEQGRIDGTN